MAKRIRLSLDGVTAVAELNEAEAPLASRKLWDALPFDEIFRHVRRSGAAGYFLSPKLRDAAMPFEDRVSFYVRGTICLKPVHGEIAIPYGQAQARTVTGNEYATCLARFVGDHAAFLDVIRRMQREGKKQLSITREQG
ncbi:MAG: DUF3830 family protein [Chloroflexota bacterium]|nr:DUF3830 family protein [Chloroflexota bacterium]MDE3193659.1 DUF3830 family protein [Chloroflexota bacterium]